MPHLRLHFGLRLGRDLRLRLTRTGSHRPGSLCLSSTAYCLRHCLCQLCVSISLASPHCQGLKCRFPALRFCSTCGLPLLLLLHLRSSGSASLAFFRLCSNCCPPALQTLRLCYLRFAIVEKKRSLIWSIKMTALPSEPVNGTKPPAIAACPPPFPIPCSASAVILPASREDFSLRTDSLMPSPLLDYTTEKETSTSASIKSETLAINASGQSSPVSAKLILSYTSMLEIALEYATRSSKHRLLFSSVWISS